MSLLNISSAYTSPLSTILAFFGNQLKNEAIKNNLQTKIRQFITYQQLPTESVAQMPSNAKTNNICLK